eukprot:3071344-Rhodomonas_salina.4
MSGFLLYLLSSPFDLLLPKLNSLVHTAHKADMLPFNLQHHLSGLHCADTLLRQIQLHPCANRLRSPCSYGGRCESIVVGIRKFAHKFLLTRYRHDGYQQLLTDSLPTQVQFRYL